DPPPHLAPVAFRAQLAQLLARDDGEPEAARVLEVGLAEDRAAHSSLHGGGRIDQALLCGALERRSMEVALVEVLVPRVRVRVDRPVPGPAHGAREDTPQISPRRKPGRPGRGLSSWPLR